jgi:hypothetical protein
VLHDAPRVDTGEALARLARFQPTPNTATTTPATNNGDPPTAASPHADSAHQSGRFVLFQQQQSSTLMLFVGWLSLIAQLTGIDLDPTSVRVSG